MAPARSASSPRSRKLLALALKTLALCLTFIFSLLVSLDLHLSSEHARAQLTRALNTALSKELVGQVEIRALSRVSSSQIRLEGFSTRSQAGEPLLGVDDVVVDFQLTELFNGLSTSPSRISIKRVQIEGVRLSTQTSAGQVALARAFTPKQSSDPGSTPIVLDLQHIDLGNVRVHGQSAHIGSWHASIESASGALVIGGGQPPMLRLEPTAFELHTETELDASGNATVRVDTDQEVHAVVSLAVEGSELVVRADATKHQLQLNLEASQIDASSVRRLVEGFPEVDIAQAQVSVKGPPTGPLDLLAKLELDLPDPTLTPRPKASATLSGQVYRQPEARLHVSELEAELRYLNGYWSGAPSDPLALQGTAALTLSDDAPAVWQATLTLPPFYAGQLPVPPLRMEAHGDSDELLKVALHAREWGLSTEGELDLKSDSLPWHARLFAPDLRKLNARLSSAVPGAPSISGSLDAQAEGALASGSDLPRGTLALRAFRLGKVVEASDARITLSPRKSQVLLSLEAERVSVTGIPLPHLDLSYRGTLDAGTLAGSAQFEASRLSLHGNLAPRQAMLESGHLELSGKQSQVSAALRVADESLEVPELIIRAPGGVARGHAQWSSQSKQLEMTFESLPVGLLWTDLLAKPPPVAATLSGTLSLAQTTSGQGAAHLEATHLQIGDLSVEHAKLDAELRQDELRAKTSVRTPAGHASAELDARVPALLHDPAFAWRQATGTLRAETDPLPLWPLTTFKSPHPALKKLDGRVRLVLEASRAGPDIVPSIRARADASDVSFVWLEPKSEAEGKTAVEGSELDASVSATFTGEGGYLSASATMQHANERLLAGAVSARLPLSVLDSKVFAQRILPTLRSQPLHGHVRLFSRPLAGWPFRLVDQSGSVSSQLWLSGSLSDPIVHASATLRDRIEQAHDNIGAVARALVDYDVNTGDAKGTAALQVGGIQVARAQAEAVLRPEEGLEGLAVGVMVNGLPIQHLPMLEGTRLEGTLTGGVQAKSSPSGVTVTGHLRAADFAARGQSIGRAELDIVSEDDTTAARLLLGSEGQLRGTAELQHTDAHPWSPSSVATTIVARELSLGLLEPLLRPTISNLGGNVNGELNGNWHAATQGETSGRLRIAGEMRISDARTHVEALGMTIDKIRANLSATSSPDGTLSTLRLRVSEAHAQSSEQNLSLVGEAMLRDTGLSEARASIELSEVPLSVDGVSRGAATGSAQLLFSPEPDVYRLQVSFPALQVDLPSSITRTLIETTPHPDVSISTRRDSGANVPGLNKPWLILIDLGDHFRVRRDDVDVRLVGEPQVKWTANTPQPSGSIELIPGGRVTIFDRLFLIERGRVSLSPEHPDDPVVDLSAQWQAPDGTTIYVSVSGTASQAEITTRDDRGLSEAQRFEMLLGGQQSESSDDRSAATAAAVGQAMATLGLNQILRNSLGEVAVRVNSTEDQRTSYAASVRLSERLWFEGNFEPGSTQEQGTDPNKFTGRLDYRLSRQWSVRTELGTSGSAFDLLWTYSY